MLFEKRTFLPSIERHTDRKYRVQPPLFHASIAFYPPEAHLLMLSQDES